MDEAFEIFDYLPIEDIEVNGYTKPLYNSAIVTYEKEEYQFSYFAMHLIFMSFIYSTVWKIGQFHKEKYEDSLLFARPYNGSNVDFKEISSVFEYSHLPEKDIFEFFALIDIDNGYILRSHTHCQVAQKSHRSDQNLSKSMSAQTLWHKMPPLIKQKLVHK
jgi:hypothetical protein